MQHGNLLFFSAVNAHNFFGHGILFFCILFSCYTYTIVKLKNNKIDYLFIFYKNVYYYYYYYYLLLDFAESFQHLAKISMTTICQYYIESWTLNLESWSWKLKVEHWTLKVEPWTLNLESWTLKVESWKLNLELWKLDLVPWKLNLEPWKLKVEPCKLNY